MAYQSALKGYRPNTEAAVGSWKDANDTVHQAGGWRAYAKEAQQPIDAVAPKPAATAASAPAKPAARPSGHAHH